MRIKFLFFLIFISTHIVAQKQHEPPLIYEGIGEVRMETKELIEGNLWFLPQREHVLYIIKAGQFEQQKININEVKNFRINEIKWDKVASKDSSQTTHHFMQKLTPKEREVNVYLHETQKTIGNHWGHLVHRTHYVFMKEWGIVYKVSDKNLYPFDKVGAELFKRCPSLANRIAEKDSTFTLVRDESTTIQRDFFLNISKEYHTCKDKK